MSEPVAEPSSAPPPEPKRRRMGLLIATGVVLLGLVGGGAYAWTQLSGGGTQPHDVVPDTVVAYASVDLDPSASQKIEMMRLLRRLPATEDELGLTSNDIDLRKLLVEKVFADCDLDFDDDVEKWLGERVGFGGLRNGKDFVLAMQVDDEKLARDGIKQFDECADEGTSGVTFRDGYALVAEDQAMADRVAKAADKGTLGETSRFTDAMDSVGDQGVASAWVDFQGIVDSPQIREEFGIPEGLELPEDFDEVGPMAMTLRADDSALEIHGTTTGSGKLLGKGEIDPASIDKDAVAAWAVSVPDDLVNEDLFEGFLMGLNAAGEGPSVEDFDWFADSTGIDLRKDLPTFYAGDPTFVVGARGLADAPSFSQPADIENLDLSLRLHGDPTELSDLLTRIAKAVDGFGVSLFVDETDDGAVLATSKDSSADGRGLADTKVYKSVAVDEGKLNGLFFIDVDQLADIMGAWGMPPEVAENVAPIEAIGMTAADDSFSLRVSFDK